MTRIGVGRMTVLLGMAWATALHGCRPEQPPAENLLMVRTIGLEHLEKGELPEAEEQFKKIVALVPKEPLGYANLGVTYLLGSAI